MDLHKCPWCGELTINMHGCSWTKIMTEIGKEELSKCKTDISSGAMAVWETQPVEIPIRSHVGYGTK